MKVIGLFSKGAYSLTVWKRDTGPNSVKRMYDMGFSPRARYNKTYPQVLSLYFSLCLHFSLSIGKVYSYPIHLGTLKCHFLLDTLPINTWSYRTRVGISSSRKEIFYSLLNALGHYSPKNLPYIHCLLSIPLNRQESRSHNWKISEHGGFPFPDADPGADTFYLVLSLIVSTAFKKNFF